MVQVLKGILYFAEENFCLLKARSIFWPQMLGFMRFQGLKWALGQPLSGNWVLARRRPWMLDFAPDPAVG